MTKKKKSASYAGRAARCGPVSNHHTAPNVAQARMDGLEHFAVEKAKCEPVWENALDAHLAEAAVESGQHLDRALWAVNEIRDRAGMPDIENIDIEKVRQERRVELAFEAHRFFDVRRWMIADQTDNKVMHGCEVTRAADGSKTWQEVEVRTHTFRKAMYFYPIPYKETVKSEDLLQNPYYE